MLIIETFIEVFLQLILWGSVKFIGACFRFIFLQRRYTFKQVQEQNWNGRVGLIVIAAIVLLMVFLNH